jgi:plasmid stability protein
MASITIHDLDEEIVRQLKTRADGNGHSAEDEARAILCAALKPLPKPPTNLAKAIRDRFEPLGGVVLELPKQAMVPDPVFFDWDFDDDDNDDNSGHERCL